MGEMTEAGPGLGGWIISKINENSEGKNNSAFYIESGAKAKFYNSYFKVFEK